jgi:S-adenosylmethionine-diacylgycerolhomoserine-N-methlytransferase
MLVALLYPNASFFGLDISSEMLETASKAMIRSGLANRVKLADGDATKFEAGLLFGQTAFDRVFISYSLSMIPDWKKAVTAALSLLRPGGELHIVDFGRQEHLSHWFRRTLRAWLARFHVEPRDSLRETLELECERLDRCLSFQTLYRGYAIHAVATDRHGADRPRADGPRGCTRTPRGAAR